ncbi:MAG: glycosyl hydrolase family 28-related protein [Flavobacterium sp.]|nr:glycosyl hydrolase family 28-related protein [Flavobacterium sp.]
MREIILNLFCLIFGISLYAQAPQGMSYQAIAYDSGGNPVNTHLISVRFSILDGSTSGTALYVETFSNSNGPTTNSQGFYSLTIGMGAAETGTFASINWGGNSRFLKVEIDPAGGTSYALVGISQLMSVPYALYSENTASINMKTVNTISDLRNLNPQPNDLVYVNGYWYVGDGGGGYFNYKFEDSQDDNDGTIIKPISNTGNGRWLRQYNGYINARFFGVVRDWEMPVSGFSNSEQIQKAIDFATQYNFSNSTLSNPYLGMTIYFPSGTYYIDNTIILKDKVNLLGDSGTQFADHEGNYETGYMFELDKGIVNNFKMENFVINLNKKDGVGGFHLKSSLKAPENNAGGIWCSSFKNISIINCGGNGIYLEGGDSSNYILPNQFLNFENVRVVRHSDKYNALKINGQLGQTTFLNCTFDGIKNEGTNVDISRKDENDLWSAVLSFINCSFQDSEFGINLEHAENITIDNCWFETLDLAIKIKKSTAINILNSRFGNSAGFGDQPGSHFPEGTGRCIDVENSSVNIERNYVIVGKPEKDEKFVLGIGNNNTINLKDNQFSDIILSESFGVMQTVQIIDNSITTEGKKLVFVDTSSSHINRLNTTIGAGETIFLRANMGSITFDQMTSSTGNIYLSGNSHITLQGGQAATFIKIDNIVGSEKCTYQLVSISN